PRRGDIEVSLVFRHFYPILAGAAERFRRYSVPLAAHGVGYRVFTLREDEAHAEREPLQANLLVHRLKAEGQPWVRDAALFQAAWADFRHQPPPAAAAGRLLQTSLAHDLSRPWLRRIRRLGVPCLYVGTMVGREDMALPAWRRWVQRGKSWLNYRPFSHVVVGTTVMARWFHSQGVPSRKLQVIPHGVDLSRFRPADPQERLLLRQKLALEPAARVFLFTGSIVPRKGIELLLRAWPQVRSHCPEARLVLVGGFERPTFMTGERMRALGDFQREMRALADRPECAGSVLFAGESSRVEDWLRAADFFVFPTEQEGMPNAVGEAMACGLPCLLTDFVGMPEVEFGQAGVHFQRIPRDQAPLSAGMIQFLQDSGRPAAAMGQRAADWVRAELDLVKICARYAEVYQTLAAWRQPPHIRG
ncbi:MAG: glycosyltransferase family 4 protein, partial [Prosthecobacter sp.]|nr:glycosyltransferase family 4 protein [Prosthecobacter sp.]